MPQQQIAKKFVALMFIFLMLLGTVSVRVGNSSKTIVVPNDYASISAAVNSASPGDTILVKSGVYYENVLITKSLTLIGEDSQTTTVIGTGGVERGQSTVFTLAADQVEIAGFTIESLNYSTSSNYATGINVEGDGCTITGNNISNTYYGIFCSVQSLTTISGNNITSNFKDGIRFCGGSLNKIYENNIVGNAKSGIAIEGYSNEISRNKIINNNIGVGVGFSYSIVFGNTLTGNGEAGLYFAGSNNTICANAIGGGKWGIYFTPHFAAPSGNKIYHNNFVDNDGDVGGSSAYNVQFWDNGEEGNYWSDYRKVFPNAAEVDASGTGDKAYVVGANNTDNHPLLSPFNVLNAADMPSAAQPLTAESNSMVAFWPFDVVKPNGVTSDETGLNPAVVGSVVGNVSFTPVLVDGEYGKALSFDGAAYVNVPMSPSLEIAGDLTIDVWVNVQELKDVEYNNIVVECLRSRASLPERTFGLAVNGYTANDGSGVPLGALRAYVSTEEEGLNEIVTTKPVVSLGQWMHVVFSRSVATGMHVYVNGEEQNVTVVSGVRDPQGSVKRETELYIGHDAVCFVDEAKLYNKALEPTAGQFLWVLWLLVSAVVAAGLGLGVFFYYRKRKR
jgi:hypothetical protein